jgi:hypothetical protein
MRTIPLAASIILAVGSATVLAQPPAGQATAPAALSPAPQTDPLVTVDFAGGTVADYVRTLRSAAADKPVNIVVSKSAAGIELSAINLRSATVSSAVDAITAAAGVGEGRWVINCSPQGPLEPGESRVYMIDYQRRQPTPGPAKGNDDLQRIEVVSLRPLIEPQPGDVPGVDIVEKPEVVLAAVEAALSLGERPDEGTPQVKFHKDSGLLIVRAGPTQMRAMIDAVESIRKDVSRRRDAARLGAVSPDTIADLRAAVEKARVAMDMKQKEREQARVMVERLEAQAAAGATGHDELARARAQLAGAEGAMQLAAIEAKRAEERFASVAVLGGAGGGGEPATAVLTLTDAAAGDAKLQEYLRVTTAALCGASGGRASAAFTPDNRRVTISGRAGGVESVVRVLRPILHELRVLKDSGGEGGGADGGGVGAPTTPAR